MRSVLVLLVALSISGASSSSGTTYRVRVEEGRRTTSSGDLVRYQLYVPDAPPGPRPAVVLSHGFARSLRYQRDNARYLAENGGVLVLAPNLVSLLGGARAQARNIDNTADHVRWLVARSATPGDSIEGRVDPARLGLAGHSAGGAVSFEAALALAWSETPVEAVALLDAVPWSRTKRVADALPALDLVSFTSEPSSCNAFGSVEAVEQALRFSAEEVRIVGGTHCDPENPTDILCEIACGGGSAEGQSRYQELMQLFFANAFGEDDAGAYRGALEGLETVGVVETRPLGPDVAASLRVNGRRGGELEPSEPLRLTVDVFARAPAEEATWIAGLRAGGRIYWVTPSGLGRRPSVFGRFAPTPLDDFVLYEGPRPLGDDVQVFLILLEGGRVVASDRVRLGPS